MSALPSQLPKLVSDADPLIGCSDAQRREAYDRLGLLNEWQQIARDFEASGRSAADAAHTFLLSHADLSISTLYRWRKRHSSDGIRGLVDGRSEPVRSSDQPVSDDPAWSTFKSLYLTIQRRSVKLCWEVVAHQSETEGWSWPSLRSIQLRVQRELPPFHADYFREGPREWHRLHGPKLQRDYSQYRAGEWWVGDFHRVDVFCRRSDQDPTIIRPLVAVWLDLRSRLVPGWLVTEHENSDAVLSAFRVGVDAYGVPHHVIIDNGKPYRSKGVSGARPPRRVVDPETGKTREVLGPIRRYDETYLRSVFGGLNIAVHFSIPFNPDSKPIERWFKTLNTQFACTFDSYCGGDKDDRFKAGHKFAVDHPDKCPTIDQFRELLGGFIKSYHLTPHGGEGMNWLSPAKAFEQCNPIPRQVAPAGALDVLLMRITKPVKVTCQGVRFNGIDYGVGNVHLMPLQGSEVCLRIDPQDAGYVLVCDKEGKPICRAENNRLAMHGVTQEHVAEGMKRRKRAKTLARSVMDGATREALDDVTTAAIRARLAAGQAADAVAQLANGTDDAAPRGVSPLRSDFTDAMRNFNRRVTPASPPPAVESMARLFDEEDDADPALRTAALEDVFSDDTDE